MQPLDKNRCNPLCNPLRAVMHPPEDRSATSWVSEMQPLEGGNATPCRQRCNPLCAEMQPPDATPASSRINSSTLSNRRSADQKGGQLDKKFTAGKNRCYMAPGSESRILKATDTTNASGNQELTIKGFISYTVTFKVVNGNGMMKQPQIRP